LLGNIAFIERTTPSCGEDEAIIFPANTCFSACFRLRTPMSLVGVGLRVQLPELLGHTGYAGKKVEICQQPNGDVKVYLERRLLYTEAAEPDQAPVRAQKMRRTSGPRKKKPAKVYTYAGRAAI